MHILVFGVGVEELEFGEAAVGAVRPCEELVVGSGLDDASVFELKEMNPVDVCYSVNSPEQADLHSDLHAYDI